MLENNYIINNLKIINQIVNFKNIYLIIKKTCKIRDSLIQLTLILKKT